VRAVRTCECSSSLFTQARAFGWSSQAFWGHQKVEELPSAAQITAAVDFLRNDVGMSSDEVRVHGRGLSCIRDRPCTTATMSSLSGRIEPLRGGGAEGDRPHP
jgi:hypothetical protein